MSDESVRIRPPRGALCRPGFEAGAPLAAVDLAAEQAFRLQRLRRHRRYLHGWGIVCGLHVVVAPSPGLPWRVRVCPGFGIDPRYREVLLAAPACVDLAEHLWSSPDDPHPRQGFLGVRAVDEAIESVPKPSLGCDCPEREFVDSRIKDSLRFRLLWSEPAGESEAADLCAGRAPCPECPEIAYLLLACIRFPIGAGEPISQDRIDNSFSRRI